MVKVYTDGAYAPSRDQGGWAFVIIEDENKIFSDYGEVLNTTNNRMEILGCIKAIEWLKANNIQECNIISDSMYVIGTMSKNWKRKLNIDLWEQLDSITNNMNIIWSHVKGHSGDKWNEHCDMLACHASKIIVC